MKAKICIPKKDRSTPIFLLLLLLILCACKQHNITKTQPTTELAAPKLKTLNVNDYNFHYIDIGEGEPVVLVHGTVGDYRTWEAQMDAFSKNHRVIAYSRRYAHPNNQMVNDSTDYSVRTHAKDLSEFLKALNLGPVHLIGHSYGALTSLVATLEHPELMRSLTLGEGPIMSLLPNVPNGEKMLNDFVTEAFVPTAEAFAENDEQKAVEIFIGGVLADPAYFSKASQLHRDIMIANTVELKGIVSRDNLFPVLSCEEIQQLKVPTLLVKGDRSPEILIALTNEVDKCIEDNGKVTLTDTSHGLMYENPKDFNKLVLDFIKK
ncbi:MAG: alpha/beta fold hydrolase [Flavobacteriaceae bacterium]